MNEYSPFKISIDKITATDLAGLKSVSEGWFVEYKLKEAKPSQLAKEVASFANTEGGWIFLGVGEKSKDEPVAEKFDGIKASEVDACLARIRNSINSHLSPIPHFETVVVKGPNPEIALSVDRAVIVIYVPRSRNTPHIHSHGVIYVRVHEASEPKPLTDRYLLDQLTSRREKAEENISRWINKKIQTTDAEQNLSYLRILISDDLFEHKIRIKQNESKKIHAIFESSDGPVVSTPFDYFATTANGFIARQIAENDPTVLGLTWRISYSLESEIIIPINQMSMQPETNRNVNVYENFIRFKKIIREKNIFEPRVLDFNPVIGMVVGCISKKLQLNRAFNVEGDMWCRMQLLQADRAIPFINIESLLDHFSKTSIPVLFGDEINIFPGDYSNSFIELGQLNGDEVSEIQRTLIYSGMALNFLLTSIGVPNLIDEVADDNDFFERFMMYLNATKSAPGSKVANNP